MCFELGTDIDGIHNLKKVDAGAIRFEEVIVKLGTKI